MYLTYIMKMYACYRITQVLNFTGFPLPLQPENKTGVM